MNRNNKQQQKQQQNNNLANLGRLVSDQIKPWATSSVVGARTRTEKRSQSTTWKQFIAAQMDVFAGTDFFTVEVVTWRGLVTYYVLFFCAWRPGVSPWQVSGDTQTKSG